MIDNLILSFKLYALSIVISFFVAVMIKAIVWALSATQKTQAPTDTARVEQELPPEPAVSDIPAIAAAVYAIMGAHRIVHIEGVRARGSWIQEGRMIHQTSHAVRHSPRRS